MRDDWLVWKFKIFPHQRSAIDDLLLLFCSHDDDHLLLPQSQTPSKVRPKQVTMKFTLSVVTLACALAPAVSFSYLETIGQGPIKSAMPSAPAPASGASYLDALTSARAAPVQNNAGSGLGSYLDALPKSPAPTGSGMTSFASSIGSSSSVAPAAPAAPVTPAAPAEPVVSSFASTSTASAPTTAGYLSALGGAASRTGGSGMRGYLDAIPSAPAARGGAGIPTYTDALASNSAVQGGAGIRSHADALSPYSNVGGQNFGPSGTEYNMPAAPVAQSSSATGSSFTMSAEGLGSVVQNMGNNGGRINFSGTIDHMSAN